LRSSADSSQVGGLLEVAVFVVPGATTTIEAIVSRSFRSCVGDPAIGRMLEEEVDDFSGQALPIHKEVPSMKAMGSGFFSATTVSGQVVLLGSPRNYSVHEFREPVISDVDSLAFDCVWFLPLEDVAALIDKICAAVPYSTGVDYQQQKTWRTSSPILNPTKQTIRVEMSYWFQQQGGEHPFEWEVYAVAPVTADFMITSGDKKLLVSGVGASPGPENVSGRWRESGFEISTNEIKALFSLSDFTGALRSFIDSLLRKPELRSFDAAIPIGVDATPLILKDRIALQINLV
jgi:hypothetical protein